MVVGEDVAALTVGEHPVVVGRQADAVAVEVLVLCLPDVVQEVVVGLVRGRLSSPPAAATCATATSVRTSASRSCPTRHQAGSSASRSYGSRASGPGSRRHRQPSQARAAALRRALTRGYRSGADMAPGDPVACRPCGRVSLWISGRVGVLGARVVPRQAPGLGVVARASASRSCASDFTDPPTFKGWHRQPTDEGP